MCGFAGILDVEGRTCEEALRADAARMANTLQHRGPDDAGVWVDVTAGIALGHRRLSIVDLSPAGHQPMVSASGRYVIAYNGEIYNSPQLRRELESNANNPRAYRGHSDTEVMLAAFDHWGAPRAISKLNGMFAFALWDRQQRMLHLCRDRLGEKPLYYGWAGRKLLFGSELKALRGHPDFCASVNGDALALFFRHNCIPAPHSIYKGFFKLPPARLLSVSAARGGETTEAAYWSLREVFERSAITPFSGSEAEAAEELEALLRDAIRMRMLADVPLGAFLSGGIDSSTVVALMQAESAQPVKTFTIASGEPAYDEAPYARRVAHHLGTEHTELRVTPGEALEIIPRLPEIYDEPFADSSQVVTYLIAKLARRHVAVCLSGDGGDEVFGGYNRHVWNGRIWKLTRWTPRRARAAIGRAIRKIPVGRWERFFQALAPVLPGALQHNQAGYKLHKLAGILPCASPWEIYRAATSHWANPAAIVPGVDEPETPLTRESGGGAPADFSQQMMFFDALSYLPDDILTKVDRATMSVSLEARVPLLDHRVVEFAWRLPGWMKIRKSKGKRILRRLLASYVPPELTERPKAGFGIPLDVWLRGPLREWAETLLDVGRLRGEGLLAAQPIQKLWREFLAGNGAWPYHLWDVLMFEAWLAAQRSGPEVKTDSAGWSANLPGTVPLESVAAEGN